MILWCGFVGLFLMPLIKRHGWEYVPLVLFAFSAWWYLGNQATAGLEDGILLSTLAGVYFVTRKDVFADYAMATR